MKGERRLHATKALNEKTVRIRPLMHGDKDRIHEIETALIEYVTPLSFFSRWYKVSRSDFLVAEIDGYVVGYVVAIRDVNYGREGHLLNIGVDPRYARQGVGTALMRHCIDVLKGRGARHLFLEVRVSNTIAQRFYSKLGFKEVARYQEYYPNGEDGVCMVKRI